MYLVEKCIAWIWGELACFPGSDGTPPTCQWRGATLRMRRVSGARMSWLGSAA